MPHLPARLQRETGRCGSLQVSLSGQRRQKLLLVFLCHCSFETRSVANMKSTFGNRHVVTSASCRPTKLSMRYNISRYACMQLCLHPAVHRCICITFSNHSTCRSCLDYSLDPSDDTYCEVMTVKITAAHTNVGQPCADKISAILMIQSKIPRQGTPDAHEQW